MMKAKQFAAVLAALMCLTLTGCQLAREDADENAAHNGDRLVGTMVTTEHLDLFDIEGYLNDNLNSFSGGELKMDGDTAKYQGRLYATLKERTLTEEGTGETQTTWEYEFEGVDGIPFFSPRMPATEAMDSYQSSTTGEGLSDAQIKYGYGDESETLTMEGTVYILSNQTTDTGYHGYFLNPIYQSADGSVYLTAGSGISFSGDQSEGMSFSQTLDETVTVTEAGVSKQLSTSLKISFSVMFPPERIVLLQFDDAGALLSRQEYAPGVLPDTLTAEPGAAYMILETHKRDETGSKTVTRELITAEDTGFSSFRAREDGVCLGVWTQLVW